MHIFRTSGFTTHAGYPSMEFVAVDQEEADAKLAAYLEQHGIQAAMPKATQAEPIADCNNP